MFDTSRALLFLVLLVAGQVSCAQEKSVEPEAEKPPGLEQIEKLPPLEKKTFVSTSDGTEQPYVMWAPETAAKVSTPVLVFLHSWSGNYLQNNQSWHQQAVQRGWIFLHPDFRGPNQTPAACGSPLARQDVLDSLNVVREHYRVDPERIYLAGSSGGGHMSMLMAGHHPEEFSAVSAWVGISDLAAWYRFHSRGGKPQRYAQMIVSSLGGAPGDNPQTDLQYRDRSPIYHLQRAGGVPFDLNAGIHDGYTGSVPIDHTLLAYNELAKANQGQPLDLEMIKTLRQQGASQEPLPADLQVDPVYGRYLHFRSEAGPARVTIFEGGHEGLAGPACEWLSRQKRMTRAAETK